MSIKKRIAAALCAASLAVSLTACADTTYICKAQDYSVKAGVYIYYVISQLNNQAYTYYYKNGKQAEDIVGEPYGDGTMTVGEYAQESAYDSCKRIIAAEMKFDEMGLKLTQDDIDSIDANVDKYWDAEYYESMGIAKESLRQVQMSGAMLDKIFLAYYDEGGIQEVSDADIDKHLTDNYVRFKLISIAIEKDNEAGAKTKAEEYKRLAAEKSFDEIIEDYKSSKKTDKDESDKQETEEEIDNNVFVNKKSSAYSSNKVVKYIDEKMKNDTVDIYSDDNYWYVIQKLDVLGYDDYVEDNKNALLNEMKSSEFDGMVDEWVEDCGIIKNDKSFSRYNADRIYEDYEEYQEKKANG